VPKRISTQDVRRVNRALVLRHLRLNHPTSRVDLGLMTGLSPATVTSVVGELLAEGTIAETGFLSSAGGRPRTLLEPRADSAYVLGCDISEHELTTAIFDFTMHQLDARSYSFPERQLDVATASTVIAAHVRELVAGLSQPASRVLGLGVGVPGMVEEPAAPDGNSLIHAELIGWRDVTLAGLAADIALPVFVDNGAKTTTLAEAWCGEARGVEHAILVLIGDGVGAGVITNGRLYRGATSSAGEWGHTKIDLSGRPCRCGSRGCVETVLGASGVLNAWPGQAELWKGREPEGVASLLAAFDAGDVAAVTVVTELIDHLGLALSGLVNLYNPQKIILGGWLGQMIAVRFLEEVRAATLRHSLPQPGRQAVVERSQLGSRGPALGAAILPIERYIEFGLSHPLITS
jgi:Transcriptional regulator/sugar kinase